MRLPRKWLIYALAWVPYWLLTFAIMHLGGQYRPAAAARDATAMVLAAARAGALAARRAERVADAPKDARFLLGHAACAIAYAAVLTAVVFGVLLWDHGVKQAVAIVRDFVAWHFVHCLAIYGLIVGVFHGLHIARRLRDERQRLAEAERLRVQAELDALRGRLQPHFLFNTLNSITALIDRDPPRAQQAVLQLSDLLRAALTHAAADGDEVTLADEWALVERYLALEALRYGERLRVEHALSPAALECRVPSFTLQPLVENAVRHAVGPRSQGVAVRITADVAGGLLHLLVEDDGPGADLARLARSAGTGLATVRRRLALRHGLDPVNVRAAPGEGFRVKITIPAMTDPRLT